MKKEQMRIFVNGLDIFYFEQMVDTLTPVYKRQMYWMVKRKIDALTKQELRE